MRVALKSHPLQEVLLKACRVAVGYDDEKKVVLLHDPTFGPASEVSYAAFKKMWKIAPGSYGKALPPEYTTLVRDIVPTSPYRGRGGNEKAAWHLLHGCTLSACGKYREAEEEIEAALAIDDMSVGYRHVILYELALHQARKSHYGAAVKSAVSASKLLPENYLVWDLLGILYLNTGDKKQAKEAQKKAMKLKKSSKAAKRMAEVIPSDYFMGFLGKSRGWASADGR
jgi:tetratricopeptide (TPR) repeat protein